jgi:hypothetical protein
MKKILIGLAAAALLLSVIAGVGLAQDFDALLINGGAEDDLAPEWQVIDGAFDRVMGGPLVWPESGDYMFWAGPDTNGGYAALQQGIPVEGYCSFCGGGWIYTHEGALADDEAQIRVDFYDGGGVHLGVFRTGWTTTADTWVHHEMCDDVPPGAVTADFTLQGFMRQPWNIQVYFDSLYFDGWPCEAPEPEPEPEEDFVPEWGSIALLGSGLMGMAGYATLRLRKR